MSEQDNFQPAFTPVSEAMQIVVQAVHEDTLGHYHLALPLYLLAIQHFQKACSDPSLDAAQKTSIEAKTKEYSTRVKQLQHHFPFPRVAANNNTSPLEPPPPSLSVPLVLPAHIVSITTSFNGHSNTTSPIHERSGKSKREGRRRSMATDEEKIAKKKLYNKQYYQKKRAQTSTSQLSTSSSSSSSSSTPSSTRSSSTSPPAVSIVNSSHSSSSQQTCSVMKLLNNTDEPIKQSDTIWLPQKTDTVLPPLSALQNPSPNSAFQHLSKTGKLNHASQLTSPPSLSSSFLTLLAASSLPIDDNNNGTSNNNGSSSSNSNSNSNSNSSSSRSNNVNHGNHQDGRTKHVNEKHHRSRHHHNEVETASSLIDMDPTIALMGPTNIIHLKRPHEKPDDLIPLATIAPTIVINLAYASTDNFTGQILDGYSSTSVCYLTIGAAHALQSAQKELESFGLSLKVFDGYRPQRAVECIYRWSQETNDQKMKAKYYPRIEKGALFELGYVARKSGHSRGSTVDLTVVTKKDSGDWEELEMGTCFDFMDELSHTLNPRIQGQARANRLLLKSLMERNGFVNYSQEWWHFTLKNEPYPNTYFDFPTTSV